MKSLLCKTEFLNLEKITWLYSGAESPLHRDVQAAMAEYLAARATGPDGRKQNAKIESDCKSALSQLLSTQPENIALLSNASEAINTVLQSLELQPGDNVVINTLEFPSGVVPWLAQIDRGLEVRVAPHHNWQVRPEDILAQVDERTRVVITSHVSYLSGARIDYRVLYEQLKSTNTLLLLDATQSLGVVPVELAFADVIVSSSYKWLLAMHGAGVLALNPVRTQNLKPRHLGWRGLADMFSADRYERYELHRDARRFETGYPSYPTIYALNAGVRLLLSAGVPKIEEHVLRLGKILIEGLEQRDAMVMTPRACSERAGNIAWACPNGEALATSLYERGVYLWGGDGRVRASIHAFNEDNDIYRLFSELDDILQSSI